MLPKILLPITSIIPTIFITNNMLNIPKLQSKLPKFLTKQYLPITFYNMYYIFDILLLLGKLADVFVQMWIVFYFL